MRARARASECVRASGHRLRSGESMLGAADPPGTEFLLMERWLAAWNAEIDRFAMNGSTTNSERVKTGSRGWMRNFKKNVPPPRITGCDTKVSHCAALGAANTRLRISICLAMC